MSPARRAAPAPNGVLLREVSRKPGAHWGDGYPFAVPTIASLQSLAFGNPVTCFVGENGSGKSTLLEAIATAAGVPAVGRDDTARDETLAPARALAAALRLSWVTRSQRGFFLRAEDFFGYARRVERLKTDMRNRLAEVDRDFANASAWARGLAAGPAAGSLAALDADYGAEGLDGRSHGQAFLTLFQRRLIPRGLYLLDEPETPLSPQNQLGLLALIHDAAREGSQFIIATHSPILLAYPSAVIVSFDTTPPAPVQFESLDHVRITRDVLSDPAGWMRRILTPPAP